MKKILLIFISLILSSAVYADDNVVWKNDLRTKFLNNETVIMEVNIRSMNSKDVDGDGFIQEDKGEIRGTFLNAIERLDELKRIGVNTLHVLPITPTGKLKALGTAGSLYSAADFSSLNTDMYDKNSDLSLEQQAKEFINEAHKRNIRIIVDVPACGSYDLFLQRPDLYVKNTNGEPVLPSDWTDVRLLATGTDEKVDTNVYSLYKSFVKYMISLGVDGIRADVAHSKTALFWKELIQYSRKKDPEFMWLAESSENWHDAISPYAVFTPYNKLLEAGFDGYYGSFFDLKDWREAKDLYNQITFTLGETKKFAQPKSVIGSFTTHDEVSPIILKGEALSNMIIWLNATLPVNSYFVDGFQTGDDYTYKMSNRHSTTTNTDDDIYFTHRGKIDIFNLSRKPEGKYPNIKHEFVMANDLKQKILPILNNGVFTPIKIKNPNIFAYCFDYNKQKVLTIGNLNFNEIEKATIKIPNYIKGTNVIPAKISAMPSVKSGKINVTLNAGEIVVLLFK